MDSEITPGEPSSVLNDSTSSSSSFDETVYYKDEIEKIVSESLLNVLVLKGTEMDVRNNGIDEFTENCTARDWIPNEEDYGLNFGPPCKVCGKMIHCDGRRKVINDIAYWIYFEENDIDESDKDFELTGMLQCVYCFGFFHRRKCVLSMSDSSYWNKVKSRDFACPLCVPVFMSVDKKPLCKSKDNSEDNFLVKLFSWLLKLSNIYLLEPRYHCDDVYVVFIKGIELENFDYG
jgi:hypothetical protein